MDVDTEHGNAPKAPKPHDDLWFPDGNVVLATNSLLFKVHKGVLSRQSSVFKDMFELPNADGSNTTSSEGTDGISGIVPELYEGLPLVTLAGDEGRDVVHLLRAAYERHYFRRDKESTFPIVMALLSLATKYDFKGIQADVIAQLLKYYPTTLEEYDNAGRRRSTLFNRRRDVCDFRLLKIAYKANLDILLPSIYYACAGRPMHIILSHLRVEFLRRGCINTLLQGREKLNRAITRLIVRLHDRVLEQSEHYPCSSDLRCLKDIRFSGLEKLADKANLSILKGPAVAEMATNFICDHCRKNIEAIVEIDRKVIWDAVPSYFGFPGWDVLQEKMAEFD